MPHEDTPHLRTWMGFPNDFQIWGANLAKVQQEIAYLAKTISKYEPVNLIVDSENTKQLAQTLLSNINVVSQFTITLVIQPINDLWLRDTGATFVFDLKNQKLGGVDFNFNGWGNKQKHNQDQNIANFITSYDQITRITTSLVMEGGGLEVDGEGTAILAESCILNVNRNPGWSKRQVEKELSYLLGIKKFIWVPGVKGAEITDGHIDFYARFVGKTYPGKVLVHMDSSDPSTQQNFNIIKSSTDAKGRQLIPIPIQTPDSSKMRGTIVQGDSSAIGYCNFYLLNNSVILANFGDQIADQNAKTILQIAFPGRTIEMIAIDNIVNGGGSVHCSTQQDILYQSTYAQNQYLMPHEGVFHRRTWMGFPSDSQIWGKSLKGVQQDIIYLAKTISKYEPVNLIVDSENIRKLVESLLSNIKIVSQLNLNLVVYPIDDLWLRDTGATFVFDTQNKKVKAVDFNFNGWGNKQKHNKDQKIAKFIKQYDQIEIISTDLILEGGGLEVDGEGTAILAQSCILNKNRNPGWTQSQVEEELSYLLGIKKFIWVPGVKNAEITDGHIDFYARFVGESKPGYVLVHIDSEDPSSLQNYQIINSSTDAKGRRLNAIPLQIPNPNKIRNTLVKGDDSAIGYCNFYLINNAVVLANFGDSEADESARQVLQNMFPERTIEMLQIDNIVNGGRSVHCSTQQDILY
ncbi:hypothetical protein ABPG72_017475 [Tetrahymena utriculariae]